MSYFSKILSFARLLKNEGFKTTFYKVQRSLSKKKYPAYLFNEPKKNDIIAFKNDRSISKFRCLAIVNFSSANKEETEIFKSLQKQFGCKLDVCVLLNKEQHVNFIDEFKYINFIQVVKLDDGRTIKNFIDKLTFCAKYDYVLLCDSSSYLHEDAIYQFVKYATENKADIVYSDEDIVDENGRRHNEHFKPDFNISLLMSCNYVGDLIICKPSAISDIAKYNLDFDICFLSYAVLLNSYIADYKVGHIPRLLQHCLNNKTKRFESGLHFTNLNEQSKIVHAIMADKLNIEKVDIDSEQFGLLKCSYKKHNDKLVSIIIPNMDHVDDLKKCLLSIQKNDYKNIEVIIVENNSSNEVTFAFYEETQKDNPNIKVVKWDGVGFNYPKLINFGAEHANGDLLLLLNNDVEFMSNDGISQMVNTICSDDIGCVGAKLLFDDNTIQHAGVTIGIRGVAGHMFYGFNENDPGYFGRALCTQDLSCVTAACLMVKRNVFDEVKEFNPGFVVDFNDVDFCLKVVDAGYRIIYNTHVRLYHYESKSRGSVNNEKNQEQHAKDTDMFHRTWDWFVRNGDPAYNVNLTLEDTDFSLKII